MFHGEDGTSLELKTPSLVCGQHRLSVRVGHVFPEDILRRVERDFREQVDEAIDFNRARLAFEPVAFWN